MRILAVVILLGGLTIGCASVPKPLTIESPEYKAIVFFSNENAKMIGALQMQVNKLAEIVDSNARSSGLKLEGDENDSKGDSLEISHEGSN